MSLSQSTRHLESSSNIGQETPKDVATNTTSVTWADDLQDDIFTSSAQTSGSYQLVELSSLSLNNDLEPLKMYSSQEVLTRIYQTCIQRMMMTLSSFHDEEDKHKTLDVDSIPWWWKFIFPWTIFFSRRKESYSSSSSSLEQNTEPTNENFNENNSFDRFDDWSCKNILGIPSLEGHDKRIPYEAHILARFWLASTMDSTSRAGDDLCIPPIRVCRCGVHLLRRHPAETKVHSVLAVVGWGIIVEFPVDIHEIQKQSKDAVCMETTDRTALLNQAHGNRESPLLPSIALVRCCQISSNLIAVSWGLDDGIIVIYRQISSKSNSSSCWDSIAILTPTQEVVAATYHELQRCSSTDLMRQDQSRSKRPRLWSRSNNSSQDELQVLFESGLMRVSDIIPIHMEYPIKDPNNANRVSSNPYVILAVSRIGGCIEMFVIPLDVLGLSSADKARDKSRYFTSQVHYADGLPDLTLDPRCHVTPLVHPIDIHSDIMVLAVYPRCSESEYNFILACAGGQKEKDVSLSSVVETIPECISYWSISVRADPNGSPIALDIELMDNKTEVKEKGPPVTVFANVSMMNTWIQDQVTSKKRSINVSSLTAVVLSTSPPICSLQFHDWVAFQTGGQTEHPRLVLSIMDYNGGISLLECCNWLTERLNSTASGTDDDYGHHQADFLMTRERFLSAVCPIVGLDRVVEYSVAFPSNDEIIVTACTSTYSICAIKCFTKSCQHTEVSDVKEVYKRNQSSYRILHGSLSAAANMNPMKGILLLTMDIPLDDPDLNISLQLLEHMDNRSLLDSYLRKEKYDEALLLIEGTLSQSINDDVRDICYKRMWEWRGDLRLLRKISDGRYFIQNVINLHDFIQDDTTMALDDLLILHREALMKLDLLLKADDVNNSQDADLSLLRLLQFRFRRLLTLTYFPPAKERIITIPSFVRLNTQNTLVQIAQDFARDGDIRTLSIMLARHWIELGSNAKRIKILQNLPLSIDVPLYAHLLPCYDEQSSFAWKAYGHTSAEVDNGSGITADINGSHFLTFVERLFNIDLTESVDLSGDGLNAPSIVEDISGLELIDWYLERAKSIYQYSRQLDIVVTFCDCIISRCSPCRDHENPEFMKTWNEVLLLRAKSGRSFQFVLYENLTTESEERLPISHVSGLEIDGLLRHLLTLKGNSSAASDFLQFTREPILSNVVKHPSYSLELRRREISHITKFSIDLLKQGDYQYSNVKGDGNLLKVLELCVTISKASSPSLPPSERLIDNDEMLKSYMIGAFEAISSKVLSPPIVSSLWNLYESLPSDGDCWNNSYFDGIHQNLLAVELLLRWVDPVSCTNFSLSTLQNARSPRQDLPDTLFSVGYNMSERMSNGFFRKVGVSTDNRDLRRLLLHFFADVIDLNEKCFNSSLSMDFIIEEYIFRRALNYRSLYVIREIILMPETFVRHELLYNCLNDFITKTASHGHCYDNYQVVKGLRDMVGSDVNPILIKEMNNCMRYFDYCIFLQQQESASMTMSYEVFRMIAPIRILRTLVKKSLVTWVVEHPEWSNPSVAADLSRNLFSVLFSRHGLDPDQVQSRRYSIEQAFSSLMNLFGPLSHRDLMLLKCMWAKAAVEENLLAMANAICCILVHDLKFTTRMDNIDVSIDDYTPLIDAIALTLSMLMNNESIHDSFIRYEISVEFLHWCNMSFPMIEQLHLDDLIYSIRLLEINTATLLLTESFRSYQRGILKFTTPPLLYGECTNPMTHVSSKEVIDAYVQRTLTVQEDKHVGAFSLFLDMLPEVVVVVGLQDPESLDNFLDDQLRRIKVFIRENSLLFMRFAQQNVAADEGIVKQLCGRGYSIFGAKRAAISTQNRGFRDALSWAVEHFNDQSFNQPILLLKSAESASIDSYSIYHLYLHLKSLRRKTAAAIKVDAHVASTDMSHKPNSNTINDGLKLESSSNDQREVNPPSLLDMKSQLKNLEDSERRRLAHEGRKLLDIARKAKLTSQPESSSK